MAFKLPEAVHETTTTTGTGTITLGGAVPNRYTFSSQLSNGDQTIAVIRDNTDLEAVVVTYNSTGNTLTLGTVLYSTNGGALIDWSAGTRDVFVGLPGSVFQSLINPAAANGLLVQTAVAAYVRRILTAGTNIQITDGDGVNGNPTISVVGTVASAASATNADTVDGKHASEFVWDSEVGSIVQAWDANLDQIAALAPGASKFLVGNGSAWTTATYGALALLSSVGASEIAAGAVHQSELNTGSTSNSATGSVLFAFASGEYGFFPQLAISGAIGAPINAGEELDAAGSNPANTMGWRMTRAAVDANYTGADITTSYQTLIRVEGFRDATNQGTTLVRQRFINTSPPYALGNVEVPLFIYLLMDAGEIIGVSVSDTPPYAYSGPTDIKPTRYSRDGRAYKDLFIPDELLGLDEQDLIPAMANWRSRPLRERLSAAGKTEEIEITHAWKNADMDVCPSPVYSARKRQNIIMLDPGAALTVKLAEAFHAGENINSLIHDGDLIIDNTPLKMRCPKGVKAVNYRLR